MASDPKYPTIFLHIYKLDIAPSEKKRLLTRARNIRLTEIRAGLTPAGGLTPSELRYKNNKKLWPKHLRPKKPHLGKPYERPIPWRERKKST